MGTTARTFPTVLDRIGRVYHVLTLADLPDAGKYGGKRAFCPLHASDNQASLMWRLDGQYAGFGKCNACGKLVLISDLNPDALAHMTRSVADELRAPRERRAMIGRLPHATATLDATSAEARELGRIAERMRLALERSERARAYLEQRDIPYQMALDYGVGYIPADTRTEWRDRDDGSGKRRQVLAKTTIPATWRDRLVFPLGSPQGAGYIGRTLHLWTPGMDENEHKARLEGPGRPKQDVLEYGPRWHKTAAPAGWYGFDTLRSADFAVLVEGAFDKLALHASGMRDIPVVALAGVAAVAEWVPANVRGVVLALDSDARGREAMERLEADLLEENTVSVRLALPADGKGKDLSERWCLLGEDGVEPAHDALAALYVTYARHEAWLAGTL